MFLQLWRDPHALFEPAEEMYLEGLYVRGMRRWDEVSSFRRDVVTPFCWVFCEARQDELAKREEQRGFNKLTLDNSDKIREKPCIIPSTIALYVP
jgi:hypothetical protein